MPSTIRDSAMQTSAKPNRYDACPKDISRSESILAMFVQPCPGVFTEALIVEDIHMEFSADVVCYQGIFLYLVVLQ